MLIIGHFSSESGLSGGEKTPVDLTPAYFCDLKKLYMNQIKDSLFYFKTLTNELTHSVSRTTISAKLLPRVGAPLLP